MSESNHDADTHDYGAHAERFRSVSEDDFGSIKEDDADDDGKGIVRNPG